MEKRKLAIEEKYAKFKVVDLKAELRKRKAALSGKKQDLFERLVWYELNANFEVAAPTLVQNILNGVTDCPFYTPDSSKYKDINANSPLSPVTVAHIDSWCNRFFATSDKGKDLYISKFLLLARFAQEGSNIFINGQCKAEMRKSIRYVVDVQLSMQGDVVGAHCECAAGSGSTAHCKHVVVLLFGIENIVREGKIILTTSCTQELQTFHHPAQPYFGTPQKAGNMPGQNSKRVKNVNFLPVNPDLLDKAAYNNKVRNLCINFCAHREKGYSNKMIFREMYMPANPYAIVWDHSYSSVNLENQILANMKLLSISQQEADEIEKRTRGPSNAKQWGEDRSPRMTSSNFKLICSCKSPDAKKKLAHRLLNPVPLFGKAIEHGKLYERSAIEALENLCGVTVSACGLVVSRSHPYLASTPDGLIEDDTVVEAKCPDTAKDQVINEFTVPFLVRDGNDNLTLDKNHSYYYQVQGQLMITGRTIAKFVVFTFKDVKVFTIHRDEEMINSMMEELELYWTNYFKPALLKKFLYKYYDRVFTKHDVSLDSK